MSWQSAIDEYKSQAVHKYSIAYNVLYAPVN